MDISIFDLFSIGIGPSSSHTLGPMRAAIDYIHKLKKEKCWEQLASIQVTLFGSLAYTGKGHGTDTAIQLGLMGFDPETIDPDIIPETLQKIQQQQKIHIDQEKWLPFEPAQQIQFNFKEILPLHSNGMRLEAFDEQQQLLLAEEYYSIGGGFIRTADETESHPTKVPYEYSTMAELLSHCHKHQLSIRDIVMANEQCWRSKQEIENQCEKIWQAMNACINRGLNNEGILPGGLKVERRAAKLYNKLITQYKNPHESSDLLNWLNAYAMAVNEENAAGGRVVTSPTNGAAGIIPAVFRYYQDFFLNQSTDAMINYLMTAGAIGLIFKTKASISGAEMGCQGEVGVASSMAAGGLAAVMGGSPLHVEKAAEIAIEHHLGLTCDPINGLVQIPCIERNAMGAVKAVNAANLVMNEESVEHKVSLDDAIDTMKQTGLDMSDKYKETSTGGLAIAVNIPNC